MSVAEQVPPEAPIIVQIDGYLVDVTEFLPKHPGSPAKITDLFNKNKKSTSPSPPLAGGPLHPSPPDASKDFNSHFGHTVQRFRTACAEYDQLPEGRARRVEVWFKDGNNRRDVGKVVIAGRHARMNSRGS